MSSPLILLLAVFSQIQIPKVDIQIDLPPPDRSSEIIVDLSQNSPGQELESILAAERQRLEEIAQNSGSEAEKQATRMILQKLHPDHGKQQLQGIRFALLPDYFETKDDPVQSSWLISKSLTSLRDSTVDQLWRTARKAAMQDRFRITDQALRAIVVRDSDQDESFRLLGYLPAKNGWATPYAIAQIEKGHQLHPKFGWIDKTWAEHLDSGELPLGFDPRTKRVVWGPAREANAAHAEWTDAWEFVTEHFRVKTNVAFDEGVAFGRKLEAFYQFFFSQMADMIGPELPLAKRWRVKSLRPTVSPVVHQVAYFATKDQYVQELTPIEGPSIADSIGYYRRPPQNASSRQRGGKGMSYFFQDTQGQLPVEATLFHEASHQLLFETAGRDRLDSNRGHYWLFEGLGTCFETVQVAGGKEIHFGAPVGARMDVARLRILENRVQTPYEIFEAYGQSGFNVENRIHDHYAQSMALTLYFLVGSDAKTRDIFMDYARDAYKGRLRGSRGLAARLGVEPSAIDEGLIQYLKATKAVASKQPATN